MKKYTILCLLVVALALGACKYDNTEDLYNNTCDTTATTYSGFLQPLLAQKCYECHSTANFYASGGGVQLEGYVNVVDYINDGTLVSSVKQDGNAVAMPQGQAKLDDCSIKRIDKWVANGAQNN